MNYQAQITRTFDSPEEMQAAIFQLAQHGAHQVTDPVKLLCIRARYPESRFSSVMHIPKLRYYTFVHGNALVTIEAGQVEWDVEDHRNTVVPVVERTKHLVLATVAKAKKGWRKPSRLQAATLAIMYFSVALSVFMMFYDFLQDSQGWASYHFVSSMMVMSLCVGCTGRWLRKG